MGSSPRGTLHKGKQNYQRRKNENRREQTDIATKYTVGYSFRMYENKNIQENENVGMWTIDSGSISDMTPNIEWMSEKKPYYTDVNLAEENRAIKTQAKGNIKIYTNTRERKREISVTDVLYAPELRTACYLLVS